MTMRFYTALEAPTFIYDIGSDMLPAELVSRLAECVPTYKPVYSQSMEEITWANACTHCGRLQGAFFLQNEPDGPFFGGPEEFQGERKPLSTVDSDVDGVSY
ncbi:hypothetical protein J2X16_003618 [Pelomonas aquatica]|uniref:Uncharacterized protein n=1 Tax=Pelomonas aquatica TaxID=431058 RepID=A0ABU1ZC97_9BURK|nr:hypothetical protein [Pelomonas aquatica]MDR7298255.1 hypothetical protein [Pelomonas aquatica]